MNKENGNGNVREGFKSWIDICLEDADTPIGQLFLSAANSWAMGMVRDEEMLYFKENLTEKHREAVRKYTAKKVGHFHRPLSLDGVWGRVATSKRTGMK